MKKFLIGVLVGIAVSVIGSFSYLRLGMAEVRADIPPGRWENYLMNAGMHASVKREAPNAVNPVQPTDENLIAGGKLYISACVGCHGRPSKPYLLLRFKFCIESFDQPSHIWWQRVHALDESRNRPKVRV